VSLPKPYKGFCPKYSTSYSKYDLLEEQTEVKTMFAKEDPESWKQVINFLNEIKM
jgi:hypothetical protein